jgi:heme/copper-type cytochrome/quinol oxidase subunit 1
LALVLSPIVFGAGGIMGLLINGSDTRTPAHYHGVIAGVNLALMGLFVKHCLPAMGRPVTASSSVRAQVLLFGLGQFVACIGLFWAGGYGAPRKMPSGAAGLVDGAVIGMYLHGLGALIAISGGVMFVAMLLRALMRESAGPTDETASRGPIDAALQPCLDLDQGSKADITFELSGICKSCTRAFR